MRSAGSVASEEKIQPAEDKKVPEAERETISDDDYGNRTAHAHAEET